MAKELDCNLEVSEFKLQTQYYVHLQTNTLGKGIEPPYPLRNGLRSITAVLLEGWLWH